MKKSMLLILILSIVSTIYILLAIECTKEKSKYKYTIYYNEGKHLNSIECNKYEITDGCVYANNKIVCGNFIIEANK
jgi:ABC-type oligopeptide transport system substrate-binding subunit